MIHVSLPLFQAVQRSQESEAAKVQLEQDIYDTRQELKQLHQEHDKVLPHLVLLYSCLIITLFRLVMSIR